LESWPQCNSPTLPAADFDALDARLQSAIQRIAGAFTRIETDRKQATAILEEIKSYAMLPEKAIAGFPATLKAHRDAIAREKARRIAEGEAARQKELAKKNEAVELRVQLQKTIAANISAKIASTIQAVNAKFHAQTIANIDAYAEVLRKWDVSKVDLSDVGKNGELVAVYHTADEVAAIYDEVLRGMDLVRDYTATGIRRT
jgi:hypothetical protein